jgi:hypothetical protein
VKKIDEEDYTQWRERMQVFNEPPATPQEEMWAVIQPSWQGQAQHRALIQKRRRWSSYGLAAAALIVFGVAIGRSTAAPNPVIQVVSSPTTSNGDQRISLPHRLAAFQYFSQSETVLTTFRESPTDDDVAQLARDLLTTTRLLLDSRIGEDPALRRMLEDLELVFSQMSMLAPGNDVGERRLITESVEDNTILYRLRSLIPTDPVRVGI